MQIVYVHYHLNRGGVTQVIINQIRAVGELPADKRPTRIGVMYGGRHDGWPRKLWAGEAPLEVELIRFAEIEYDEVNLAQPEPLAEHMARVLKGKGFGPQDTLLHVHNHSLGKNVSWPGAISALAKLGYRLLLQLHDFAEDFRPENYRRLMNATRSESPAELAAVLYPCGPAIHYAALTQRDAKILKATGIAEEQLHLLPNPIGESLELPDGKKVREKVRTRLGIPLKSRLLLYPVRGIRRKNLGELLLLSALSNPAVWYAVTLAPQNPAELESFKRWQALCKELKLRCLFDTCREGGVEFTETVAASDVLITTSIAEGFGMVFLEGWLAGKPLVGRDLPEITCDAVKAGLKLDGLYRKLAIPLDWVGGRIDLGDDIYHAYQWACHDYGVPIVEREEVVAQLDHLMEKETIDFAHLPTVWQQKVIRRAAAAPVATREALCAINPQLDELLSGASSASPEVIAANAAVVRKCYSMTQMSSRLGGVYRRLLAQKAGQVDGPLPAGDQVLGSLLRLSRLHPLRLES